MHGLFNIHKNVVLKRHGIVIALFDTLLTINQISDLLLMFPGSSFSSTSITLVDFACKPLTIDEIEEVMSVLKQLKIVQPRLSGGEAPNIANGFCLNVTNMTWSKPL